jgi:flagellar biosynthesis anti-sigma factor FlgM
MARLEVLMKVQNPDGIARPLTPPARPAKAGKAAAVTEQPVFASPTGVGTDRLEVSDQARALQTAAEALKQLPPIRTDTVERLKARIKAGAYRVAGEQIAEQILTDDPSA